MSGPTASLFGRGGIKGDLHLFVLLILMHYTGIGLFDIVSLDIFGYTYSWLHYILMAKLLLVDQISMDNAASHPWIKGSHTASYNFGLKSCLEHPALLAGCVCVCTFSKEVKPVLVFAWFT